jgi:ribose-phosphate pyrophosphokinase
MTYAPYAQQDRVCNDYESLTSKVFSELINAQNYQSVTVLDCHSDVMPALLNNCTNISPINLVARLPFDEDTYLICPDSGALKRIYNISTGINKIKGIVRADKRRDTMTGKITGTEVLHENLNGAKCIIVDDICVGGATFINLSKELKNKGAGEILLYVTHGIFSNGLDCLFDSGIDAIYTTNSRNRNEELNSKLNILII